MRKGETSQPDRKQGHVGGFQSDGGYLVPPETETRIESVLKLVSPIRAVAGAPGLIQPLQEALRHCGRRERLGG
jgi:predicted phage gp36 major capsid-like protein